MRTARLALIAMLALTALAFALRMTGLDKLQPCLQEADPYLVLQVRMLREHVTPQEPRDHGYFAYPTLIARTVALAPAASVDPATPPDELLERHVAAASADFVRVRTLVALIATLLVPATWLLARRFLGPVGALVATALVALSVLHLWFSQQARPHGAHASMALIAVVTQMWMLRAPSLPRLALASLATAGAIAILHSGVFAVPPLAVAWWLARRRGAKLPWWTSIAALSPSVLAMWLLYPRSPTLQPNTLEWGGHTLHLEKIDGTGLRTIIELLWGHEPVLLALAALGLVVALVRSARPSKLEAQTKADAWVACAYALPYTLALGVFGETFDRFLLPLLPYFAVLAGAAVELACNSIARAVRNSTARVALQGVVAVIALAFPAVAIERYTAALVADDTLEQATAWLREHADGRVLVSPRLGLPLFQDRASLEFASHDYATKQAIWVRYQLEHLNSDDSPAAPPQSERRPIYITPGKLASVGADEIDALLVETKPDFAVVEVSRLMTRLAGVRTLRETLAQRGTLVATFRGGGDGECEDAPIDYQDVPHFVERILHTRCFGPCVEIYALGSR
jgi:hypothetical protein